MTTTTRSRVGTSGPILSATWESPPPWLLAAGRVWGSPLWAHLAVLVALVIALAPFMRLDGAGWVEEEGRIGLQVEALGGGGWEYEYAGESFDAEHRWSPLGARSEGVAPAPEQPAYVSALRGLATIVGTGAALYVLSMLGVVLAAAVAWMAAGEIDRRAARPAFWLVVASPLLVHGYVLWSHALTAGVVGVAVLAALRIARREASVGLGALLVLSLAVGVVLRPEALFFAGALAVAVAGVLGFGRRWKEAVGLGVASIGGSVAAFVGRQWWIERITGVDPGWDGLWADAGGSLVERFEARAAAAWRFVFDGGNVSFDAERLVAVALVAAFGGGLFLRMRGREGRFLGATVAAGAALGVAILQAIRSSEAPLLPILGFLAAWPVAVFGLSALPWRRTTGRERMLLAAVVVFGLAVVAALPAAGAEHEWGSRLLAPLVVPLAAVVTVGLVRRLTDRSWEQQAAIIAALVLLAAFPTSRGLETVRDFRGSNAQIEAGLERVATDVVVIDNPRLVRTPIFSWRLDDDIDWYVSYGDAPGLLSALAEAGHDEVTILPDPTRQALDIAPYATAEAVEAPILEARGVPVFRLTAPAAEAIDA